MSRKASSTGLGVTDLKLAGVSEIEKIWLGAEATTLGDPRVIEQACICVVLPLRRHWDNLECEAVTRDLDERSDGLRSLCEN